MRYYYKTLFGVLISGVLCLHTAQADSVPIAGTTAHNGHITQGGLLTLTLSKGASATLDETPLMISAHGHIALGFHRDDEATQHLIITTSDGTRHHTALTPSARRYKTQSITGLAGKYVTPPQETLARIAADREAVIVARSHQTVQDDFITGGFDWPLIGTITGIYGSQRILNGKPRAPHYGIDIAAPKGAPVTAPADGIITMAHDLYYTGGTTIIDHGLMISSTLLHLETMAVKEGDKVTRGLVIGTVGSTGRSTGPHLDWRINWGTKRLDPQLAVTSPH